MDRSKDTNESDSINVWVVGGGFSGLATAAALRRIAGIDTVVILECSSNDEYYAAETGAVAKVSPNGFRALNLICPDSTNRVLEEGRVLKAVNMIVPHKNETVVIPEKNSTDDYPSVLIRWGRLRQILQELQAPNTIYTNVGSDVSGYSVDEEAGVVGLVNEQGETIQNLPPDLPAPTLIVAADGINSVFQSLIRMKSRVLSGPDAPAIRKSNLHDNGRVNVNAVVTTNNNDSTSNGKLPAEPGTALAYTAPDNSITVFASTIADNITSWAMSVADTYDETGSLTQYFGKADREAMPHIHTYLMERLEQLNDEENCQFVLKLIQMTPYNQMFVRRSQQVTLVGPTFVSYDHRVVLVGEAAHAMSPSYGQAANFALEDAVTLALAIKRFKTDIPQALQTYSNMRVDRCEEMFRRSAERVIKLKRGEKTEDVVHWVSSWKVPDL